MITLSKLYSSAFDLLNRRVLTVFQFGTKTADECAPFGDDSNPVNGMDAVYADTSIDDQKVIIGYFNMHQMAAPGEKRFYSLKKELDGSYSQAFYTWMKADGTFEIGGTADNMVRYAALNTALQLQVTKLQGELVKIAAGIVAGGGTYTPGSISLDISTSKINEIKCL